MDDDFLNVNPKYEPMGRCKKCGNKSAAKDFKIDDDLGIMVCSNCFKSSATKKFTLKKEKLEEKEESSGEREVVPRTIVIDGEEDALSKIDRPQRLEKIKEVRKEKEYERLTCYNCGFNFKYNKKKNWPSVCPACAIDIKEVKRGVFRH